jgi:urease accessory protein
MSDQLVVLLHLCDSLFPIGSFAHSDGLETATASGAIQRAGDLAPWMETVMNVTLERSDGPAVRDAWRAFTEGDRDALQQIDGELYAMRPAGAAREAGRAIGSRLLKTWMSIRPENGVRTVVGDRTSFMLPVAFGIVTAASAINERQAVEGFMYTRLAAVVSAAMRLMPLGQHDGHALLAQFLARVPDVTTRVLLSRRAPESFAPAMDLAAMSQQYIYSRLFRS